MNLEMEWEVYITDPKKNYSKEIMEGQLQWRKDWLQNYPKALEIYAQSPQ